MAAQDDGELFDLYAADGAPLGVRKARSLVHRDGDWHKSLHLWVILRAPGRPLRALLQRRSADKDTWPRAVDVPVAGHYRAGESLEQALRESEEEIGLPLTTSDVTRLGLRIRAEVSVPGINDNELQDIFAALTDRQFASLRPSPDEVEALYALPMDDLYGLLTGAIDAASCEAIVPGSSDVHPATIMRTDLIPSPDGYYEAAARSLSALAAGEKPIPFTIGGHVSLGHTEGLR